jgi:hypothetical protein
MSTLNVSNITDGTTTVGTSYVVNGSAKAWVNFNGTGTIAVRDSQNVSGLVDNGTGDYTSNFTSGFSAVDYAGTTSSSWDTVTSGVINFNRAVGSSGYSTTSLFRMQNVVVDSTTNRTGLDVDYLYAVFHGDLA